MGLRNRIMLLVALGMLISTVPLGIMGLGMVRAATDRILEERLAIARSTADHLSARLAEGWFRLDHLSRDVAPAALAGDRAVVDRDFSHLVRQMMLFSGGVVLLDRAGRTVAAGPPPVLALPLASMPEVLATLATGRPQTGILVRGRDGISAGLLTVPVLQGAGEVSGVVVGVIDLNMPTLLTFINGLALGTTGHAVIVNIDGTVLASTDRMHLFTRDEHPEFFGNLIAGGQALVGPAEQVERGNAPERHVMAFAPLVAVPWGLGIGQSEQEAFGPIRRLRDRVVGFEILVLLAALLFAWADTTAVVAPLRVLRAAAERIAEGDLAPGIEVQRGDEIGTLARSFETMRWRLQQSLEENARLQERLRSVAMLEERERIAREMHDSVGQVLGYVNTKAQAVRALLDANRVGEAQTQLVQLEQTARDLYTDLREAILSLRTATAPDRQLLSALDEYVRRFTELSGVETALEVEGGSARYVWSPTEEAHLVRIIQEALTNVRKHAAARRAVVRFATRDDTRVVTVEDDGLGIEATRASATPATGFGLATMRERAAEIGGTLTVRGRPEGGTVVEIVLPAKEVAEFRARAAG